MPGLFGGVVDDETLAEIGSRVYSRPFNETEYFEGEAVNLGSTHHGEADPGGHTTVETDDVVGLLYGAITNPNTPFDQALVRRVLDAPGETLAELDGPFLLVAAQPSSEEVVVATDRRGTRSCYYTDDGTFAFSSELTSLLPVVVDPELDLRAVADMLTMLCVWGEKTMLTAVKALRPGSYLRWTDGEVETGSYYSFTFEERTDAGYVDDLVSAYADAVEDTLDTVDGSPGLWLSGGLDSRVMAAAMKRSREDFGTFTYRRPMERETGLFKTDVELARQVADALGVENTQLSITPDTLRERLDEMVEITDGMISWRPLVNLSTSFDLTADDTTATFEASDAGLVGVHVEADSLGGTNHPADELYDMHVRNPSGVVRSLLTADIEPKDTFFEETRASRATGRDHKILDVASTNYYFKNHYLSSKVARAFVGTREPLTGERVVRVMNQVPTEKRRRKLPFSGIVGPKIPMVPAPMKLELIRRLNPTLAEIPYEGTQVPPTSPHWLHVAGFVVKETIERSTRQMTAANWLREDSAFGEYVEELLRSIADRPAFAADAVHRIRREQFQENKDRVTIISALTTVELFIQQVLES